MKTEKGDLGKKTWEMGAEGRVGAWDFSLSLSTCFLLLQAAFLGSRHTWSKVPIL